jgi:alginate O-acetyltransferase complex protein AlgI
MLFNSYTFLFLFLPIVLVGFYALHWKSRRAALAWITLGSLVFYGYWDYRYLALIILSISANCALGYLIAHEGRRMWLVAGVAANLAVLAWFKYALFAFVTFTQGSVTPPSVLQNIVLPLGISFFTFQQIAYLLNVWRGQEKPARLETHAFIVLFFPHLIAGPIVLYENIVAQVKRTHFAPGFFAGCFRMGLLLFSIGLFKKVVVADSLAPFVNDIFSFAARPDADLLFADAVLGALGYSLQLYFDFSAYSDMAIGLGLMFGLKLPINFNSPYKSTSIIDFWRRWHMTLSSFFRNYVYIPLGGNRRGLGAQTAFILVVFFLTGLWHGAAWTFVVWGVLHGLLVVVNHLWASTSWATCLRASESGLIRQGYRLGSWVLTMLAVAALWVLFRADSWETVQKFGWAVVQFQLQGVHAIPDKNIYWALPFGILFLLSCCWMLPNSMQIVRWVRRQSAQANHMRIGRSRSRVLVGRCAYPVITGFCLYFAVASISHVRSAFLYFNF